MRIYKMTATFGKFSHETLTLEPGLNIIQAPNEWGKSTWCAFLTAMLYGIDTAQRSRQGSLPDKEHFAPWSGEPMSGSLEICWQGRDITIERVTARRVPLGQFRAFETHTGLPVEELTAANCGQLLLGVERSVFTRAGFIRFQDLPVTQDEALRHRLNALVTTGEEGDTAQRLERQLRELKNRCRHNKTGLLPQLEAEKARLEEALRERSQLQIQARDTQARLEALEQETAQLENHEAALAYEAALRDARQVELARKKLEELASREEALSHRCRNLAPPEQIEADLEALQLHTHRLRELEREYAALAHTESTVTPEQARQDADALKGLERRRKQQRRTGLVCALCLPVLCFFAGYLVTHSLPAALLWLCICAVAAGIGFGLFLLLQERVFRANTQALCAPYSGQSPDTWEAQASLYENRLVLEQRIEAVRAELAPMTGSCQPEDVMADSRYALEQQEELAELTRQRREAQTHLDTLSAMARPAVPPAAEDRLTCSMEQTHARLDRVGVELRHLRLELGRVLGRLSTCQPEEVLRRQLQDAELRIARLEETCAAATLAQEALKEATAQLQRRFAPRITQRAADLFSRMTDGRYHRILLEEDLSVSAGAEGENTLRSILWRSDGTADQLYLALRLAVAAELTPDAPLILDDALVRFDDQRLRTALSLLQEQAQQRQILLFTCHSREMDLLSN